jgi:hypoxanthine phosphoribosyltransferase
MTREESWRDLLALIARETRGVALIALLGEALAIAALPLLPSDQRFAALVAIIVLLLFTLAGTVFITSRPNARHHDNPTFEVRVRKLKDRLDAQRFRPQLIVAIPRGGLNVAGILAKQFGDQEIVPVIALTPLARSDFDNPFNHIQLTRTDFGSPAGQQVKVLIVDDICMSGTTLDEAKSYVERSLDHDVFDIRTAAVSFSRAHARAIAPSFYVDTPTGPLRDASGEYETPD